MTTTSLSCAAERLRDRSLAQGGTNIKRYLINQSLLRMDQELIVRNSDLGLSLGLSYSFGLLLCKLRLSILPEEVDIRLVFFLLDILLNLRLAKKLVSPWCR